jgi:hypothetical protein
MIIGLNTETEGSTIAGCRPDGWMGFINQPPLLIWEQKKSNNDLIDARNDLTQKFRWMPHYHQDQYVFGVAVAGNQIDFGQMKAAGGGGTLCNFVSLAGPFMIDTPHGILKLVILHISERLLCCISRY